MSRFKARHVTQAAKPQGRYLAVALVIFVIWIAIGST
jgi:hypothetical protein